MFEGFMLEPGAAGVVPDERMMLSDPGYGRSDQISAGPAAG